MTIYLKVDCIYPQPTSIPPRCVKSQTKQQQKPQVIFLLIYFTNIFYLQSLCVVATITTLTATTTNMALNDK